MLLLPSPDKKKKKGFFFNFPPTNPLSSSLSGSQTTLNYTKQKITFSIVLFDFNRTAFVSNEEGYQVEQSHAEWFFVYSNCLRQTLLTILTLSNIYCIIINVCCFGIMSWCVGGLLWLYCDVHEFINGPTLIFYLITAFIFKDQIFFFFSSSGWLFFVFVFYVEKQCTSFWKHQRKKAITGSDGSIKHALNP